MDPESKQTKVQDVLQAITNQPDACELKWSLFYSAVLSGNPSVIKPYPSSFLDTTTNDLRLEHLQETANLVPAFEDLPSCVDSLPEAVTDLLYWALIKNRDPRLKRIPVKDYHPHLQKSLATKPPSQWPQYVFEVLPNFESNAEKKFQRHKEQLNGPSDSFAFHGSKLECFFSILNFGLAQHLCKRDLYGDGAYLSTSMDVSLNFSSNGSAWPKSHLFGNHFACVALCEYVSNPLYIRNNPKEVPKSYVVLTNNEIVRVRYVLIFTKGRRRRRQLRNGELEERSWSTGAKITVGVILYLCLLGFVGIYNRGSFFKDHFGSLWEQ